MKRWSHLQPIKRRAPTSSRREVIISRTCYMRTVKLDQAKHCLQFSWTEVNKLLLLLLRWTWLCRYRHRVQHLAGTWLKEAQREVAVGTPSSPPVTDSSQLRLIWFEQIQIGKKWKIGQKRNWAAAIIHRGGFFYCRALKQAACRSRQVTLNHTASESLLLSLLLNKLCISVGVQGI